MNTSDHLHQNNQTYLGHLKDAWTFSAKSLIASIAFFAHGIAPFTLEHTGSSLINQLNNDIVVKQQQNLDRRNGQQN